MKTYALAILLTFMSTIATNQDLVGEWKGKIDVQGTQLRIIFHVSKTENQFRATMDSPDQNVYGIVISSLTFDDPKIKFEILNLGMVYEGTLSGNQITGKWMQSGQNFTLTLAKTEN